MSEMLRRNHNLLLFAAVILGTSILNKIGFVALGYVLLAVFGLAFAEGLDNALRARRWVTATLDKDATDEGVKVDAERVERSRA